MPFKISRQSTVANDSPEALFRDLRSRTVQGLLAHQADILRDYIDTALDKADESLPTSYFTSVELIS